MKRIIILTGIAVLLTATIPVQGIAGGNGNIRFGYVYIDNAGNLATEQETFNRYEGIGLSFEGFNYRFKNGTRFSADLRQITRNDRNLTASIARAGKYSLSIRHSQYRRIYDSAGNSFTRRRSSRVSASVKPDKRLEIFGDISTINQRGNREDIPAVTSTITPVDFSNLNYTAGFAMTDHGGQLRVLFRNSDYTNDVATGSSASGRKGNEFQATASLPVPRYEWLRLSGGYNYRKNEIDNDTTELRTNLGWGAAKAFLPYDLIADYRLMFARTNQNRLGLETDNVINTIAVGKNWRGKYGLRVGYENRIADDLIDRTESHSFLFSGWWIYKKRLIFRSMVKTRSDDVVTGATTIGDRSVTNHRVSMKYILPKFGDLKIRWTGKVSDHQPDLLYRDTLTNRSLRTRADYNVLTAALNIRVKELGRLSLSHSYYLGQYENNSDGIRYQFSDHLFQTSLRTTRRYDMALLLGGTYYRSRRDNNIEKFSLSFGADYLFLKDHHAGIRYDVFNYDDYLTPGDFYTGNIVEAYISKNIEF